MIDSAHVFGHYDHLVGVCTRPLNLEHAKSVGVLMLTPGMLHHVGPSGLHVALARKLSEYGYYSLRFCLSGIGESFGVGVAGCSTDRAADEVRQAMDWMAKTHGIQQFVTFGLCSGADDSIYAALSDRRIVGSILMDGCGYRTTGFYLRKYLWRLPIKLIHRMLAIPSKATATRKSAKGYSSKLVTDEVALAATLPSGEDIREFPDRVQAEKEFQALAARGVKMLLLYTGGVSQYFNGERQFLEMFPKLNHRDNITCHYYPRLDHVARLAEDRTLILDVVADWIGQWQVPLATVSSNGSEADRIPQDCKHQLPVTTNPFPTAQSHLPVPTSTGTPIGTPVMTQWNSGHGHPLTSS